LGPYLTDLLYKSFLHDPNVFMFYMCLSETFSMYADKNGAFWDVQPVLVQKLTDPAYNISMENHEFGLPPYNYEKFSVLKDTYDVLSTTLDRCAMPFFLHKEYKLVLFCWLPTLLHA
jgi:hypothetical protein